MPHSSGGSSSGGGVHGGGSYRRSSSTRRYNRNGSLCKLSYEYFPGATKYICYKNHNPEIVYANYELAEDPENGIYFISHSDCEDAAKELDSLISARNGVHAGMIADIGPVIGAHIGPGTIGFYFIGRHR